MTTPDDRAALVALVAALDNYFSYSPSRRDDHALGPLSSAMTRAKAALAETPRARKRATHLRPPLSVIAEHQTP